MLGSGNEGAIYAAQMGLSYCFAHFINADAGTLPLDLYRRQFRPSHGLNSPRASIGVSVTVAETEEEAHRVSQSRNLWVLWLLQGRPQAFPSIEEAENYPYTEQDLAMLEGIRRRGIVGTPEQVRGHLLKMGEAYGVDEFVILTITHDHVDRVRSYELLADAFALAEAA